MIYYIYLLADGGCFAVSKCQFVFSCVSTCHKTLSISWLSLNRMSWFSSVEQNQLKDQPSSWKSIYIYTPKQHRHDTDTTKIVYWFCFIFIIYVFNYLFIDWLIGWLIDLSMYWFIYQFISLLKAYYSPVNLTGSPQGF